MDEKFQRGSAQLRIDDTVEFYMLFKCFVKWKVILELSSKHSILFIVSCVLLTSFQILVSAKKSYGLGKGYHHSQLRGTGE